MAKVNAHMVKNACMVKKLNSAPPKTMSHKQQKKDCGDIRIGVGKRVKISWQDLFHMLKTKAQQDCISHDLASSCPYFGTVLWGGGNKQPEKDGMFDLTVFCMKKSLSIMW